MKQQIFRFTIREAVTWIAILLLGIGLYAEHTIARDFELATRQGIQEAFQELAGAH